MHILALEPYYGGSHRAFLDGWAAGSAHRFTPLTLPPHHWKWRMRHAAITLAEWVRDRWQNGERWDALWCSDMLDLATFSGLCPELVGLPRVVYFHENQLTYPVRDERERDLHFAFTNLTTALAADHLWINSAYHRDTWLDALEALVRKMPDHSPRGAVATIRRKTSVMPPGIDLPDLPGARARGERAPGPLRILWAARWEHDKDPDTFFEALDHAADAGLEFRLSVLGESFRQVPPVFERARQRFADRLDHWGFQERRDDYAAALAAADVAVSTAQHEFFGISMAEAMAAGCRPLLPDRLAYPELLADLPAETRQDFFYDGSTAGLSARLLDLGRALEAGSVWGEHDPTVCRRAMERFGWSSACARMDDALQASVTQTPTSL